MVDHYRSAPVEALDLVFAALADPTRRAMVRRLTRGTATVSELGAGFPISKQAVSRHVRVLERAGLIQRRIEGRVHRCVLVPKPFMRLESWIVEQRRIWNHNLDRMEHHLTSLAWTKTSR